MAFHPAVFRRRVARVRLLLDTHDEAYDGAISRPERSQTGFSETRSRRMTCALCAGQGCERCEKGRVAVEVKDAYDNGETGFWAGPQRSTMDDRQMERELERLEKDDERRRGVYGKTLDFESTLLRSAQRDGHGDYARVRTALDFAPPGLDRDLLEKWLALTIPGAIRVPRWAYEAELESLSEEVETLRHEGLDMTQIARALGISRRQVRSMLRQRKAAA